jgi:hypothetical protein
MCRDLFDMLDVRAREPLAKLFVQKKWSFECADHRE